MIPKFNNSNSKRRGFGSSTSVAARYMMCAHCRRRMGDFDGGYSRGFNGEPLCYPNKTGRPDCYHLVTVHMHSTPCTRSICFEDHEA